MICLERDGVSALRLSERGTVDADGVTLVSEAAEESLDEGFVPEEVVPFVVVEVGGDEGWASPVSFFEELEEDVGLLGMEVEVTELVDEQDIDADQLIEELSSGAVGEGSIHFIEEVLSPDEEAAVAVLDGLHEKPGGESGLSDSRRPDEDDVLGLWDEVELGEGAKLTTGRAGLFAERKRLESPLFGEPSASDTPAESGLLAVVPLGAKQANEECLVGELFFVGVL